jgi:hypothetical protein
MKYRVLIYDAFSSGIILQSEGLLQQHLLPATTAAEAQHTFVSTFPVRLENIFVVVVQNHVLALLAINTAIGVC